MFTHEGKENDLNQVFEFFYKGNGYTTLTGDDNADDECACEVKRITNEQPINQSCLNQTHQRSR